MRAPSPHGHNRWNGRRLPCLLAVSAVVCASSSAAAAQFTDTRDGFSLTVDPPGLPACVTYPVARFDRIECGGLDPSREAAERASAPAGTQWVGASVFRGDSWGFRLSITRVDDAPRSVSEAAERAFLGSARDSLERTLKPGQLVGGEAALAGELITLNEVGVARFAFAFKVNGADGSVVLQSIVYVVPAEVGIYTVTFLADRTRAVDLGKIAERSMQSLHVRPRPRASSLGSTLLVYALLPGAALLGLIILVVRLASIRRERPSSVPWPSLREARDARESRRAPRLRTVERRAGDRP